MNFWDFSLNGVLASTKGIAVSQLPEYMRPQERKSEITIPGRSGVLVVREPSGSGRVYDTVTYPVEMLVPPETDVSTVLAWLEEGGQLELGNLQGWVMDATLSGQMVVAPVLGADPMDYHTITALFSCQPWRAPTPAVQLGTDYPLSAYAAYGRQLLGTCRGCDRIRVGMDVMPGDAVLLNVRLTVTRESAGLSTVQRECEVAATAAIAWDAATGWVYDTNAIADSSSQIIGDALVFAPRPGVDANAEDEIYVTCVMIGETAPELTDDEEEVGAKAMIRLRPEWRRV